MTRHQRLQILHHRMASDRTADRRMGPEPGTRSGSFLGSSAEAKKPIGRTFPALNYGASI